MFYPNWNPTQTYQTGDVVQCEDGLFYFCKRENTGRDPMKGDGPWYTGTTHNPHETGMK